MALAVGILLIFWATISPLLNTSVAGFLLIRRRSKPLSGRYSGGGVRSRVRSVLPVVLWSIFIWGLPIVAVYAILAGNQFEVGHHPLPEGLERVWLNSAFWSVPGAVILLVSAPLAFVYLDRLLRVNVKNAVIYAFSAWVFMRISWLQAFSWLRSSQLGDEWRQVFVTGPATIEVSIAVATVALIVAMIVAKFDSSVWTSALIASLALPAVVQYWMAGEPWALLEGIFSLALFGYATSRMMQRSRGGDQNSSIMKEEPLSERALSLPLHNGIRFVVASVLCTVGISVISVIVGVKPMSVASTLVVLVITVVSFIGTIVVRRIIQERFNEIVVATIATISSLVVASSIIHGSWIPSNVTHPDFDGWLLLGAQVIPMAVVGCVGLIFTLHRQDLYDFRPFLAGLTIPLLGYLIFWGFPTANISSWEMGSVISLSAHKWAEISLVVAFILGAMWFVFGPWSRSTDRRIRTA